MLGKLNPQSIIGQYHYYDQLKCHKKGSEIPHSSARLEKNLWETHTLDCGIFVPPNCPLGHCDFLHFMDQHSYPFCFVLQFCNCF